MHANVLHYHMYKTLKNLANESELIKILPSEIVPGLCFTIIMLLSVI